MSEESKDIAANKMQELRAAIDTARLCSEQVVEAVVLQSKLYRAYYESLVREGFSETQAMDIIKSRGIS